MTTFTRFRSVCPLVYWLIALLALASCARPDYARFNRTPPVSYVSPAVAHPTPATPVPVASNAEPAVATAAVVVAQPMERTTELSPTAPTQRFAQPAKRHRFAKAAARLAAYPVMMSVAAKADSTLPRPVVRQGPATNGNGITVAALVCGIVGLIIFPYIFGPLAIIFGAIGLSRIRRDPSLPGRGRSIAGLVLGIIGTLYFIIYAIARS